MGGEIHYGGRVVTFYVRDATSQLKSRNMLDLVVHSGLVVHLGELLGH
jgi:hypothetical protein